MRVARPPRFLRTGRGEVGPLPPAGYARPAIAASRNAAIAGFRDMRAGEDGRVPQPFGRARNKFTAAILGQILTRKSQLKIFGLTRGMWNE